MNTRQFIFGLVCGAVIAAFAGSFAYAQVISWSLTLVGVGLMGLNTLAWTLQRQQHVSNAYRLSERASVKGRA